MSPLKDDKTKQQYGADIPYVRGKHIQALFLGDVSPAPSYSQYDQRSSGFARQKFKEYLGGKDLNTALRETDEAITDYVASQQGK
jgi:multiple sugar transport system substrate-binding protein